MADALDMTTAILDIHKTDLWSYVRNAADLYPEMKPEIAHWCEEAFGKNAVLRVAREVVRHDRHGAHNSYRVFLLFKDEPSMVHFRLRWGGQPVKEMPASRSTVYE